MVVEACLAYGRSISRTEEDKSKAKQNRCQIFLCNKKPTVVKRGFVWPTRIMAEQLLSMFCTYGIRVGTRLEKSGVGREKLRNIWVSDALIR